MPPQLVESGIGQLWRPTSIFGETVEAYEQRENEEEATIEKAAHSPRVPKGTSPSRVAQEATK